MLRRLLFTALLALIPLMSSAQRTVTASGVYTYYAPMNVAPDQAELTAIERAKVDIIEKEFGTVVGVSNYTEIINEGEQSSVKFLSLGESEVKGEWIETLGQPEIVHNLSNNLQVITVSIKGRIRESARTRIVFEAAVLRNGITKKYESSDFRDGDDLFISFESPVDGYVAVYLYDLSGVNRLLPMYYSGHPAYAVCADVRYIFFADGVSSYSDIESKNLNAIHSDYGATCNGNSEINRIYVIFSPNPFNTAGQNVSDDILKPVTLSFEEFQRWLSRNRKRDKEMTLIIRDIIIRK